MWVSPHHSPAETVYVEKRTGKRTVCPECVVLGRSVGVASGFAGLVWCVVCVMLIFFQQVSVLDSADTVI